MQHVLEQVQRLNIYSVVLEVSCARQVLSQSHTPGSVTGYNKLSGLSSWHFPLLTLKTLIFIGLQTYMGLHFRKTLTNKKTKNNL